MYTMRSAAAAASLRRRTTAASARRYQSSCRGGDDGGSGRANGFFERFRQAQKRNKPKREPSFAEKFLDPAARGELNKKHQSGIPKLAARKPKSKTAIHDQFPGREAQAILMEETRGPEDEYEPGGFQDEPPPSVRPETTASADQHDDEEEDEPLPEGYKWVWVDDEVVHEDPKQYAADVDIDEQEFLEKNYFDQGYDSEAEYDDWNEEDKIDPDNHPDITKDEDGFFVLQYDPDQETPGDSDDESDDENAPMVRQQRRRTAKIVDDDADPEEKFFSPDITDFDEDDDEEDDEEVPGEILNQVRPLQELGPNLEDFLEASILHPTRYAQVRRYNLHHESRREAVPNIPKYRKHPPYNFVKSHKRYMYVSGLPHPVFESELGDYDNPLHRTDVTMAVAKLLKMSPEHISPASMTSAFIGFEDNSLPEEESEYLWDTIAERPFLPNHVIISRHSGENESEFTKDSPDSIVMLKNLPRGITAEKLAQDLFPDDTELAAVYGPLEASQILVVSPNTALVRFDSSEKAKTAISSESLKEHLKNFGQSRLQFFWTVRELVHSGFSGPGKGSELKRRGQRLIVDGDVPSDKFFRSHAGCIHLRYLDENVTKQDIADLVQPYCGKLRDVSGSVEFVKCLRGTLTGRAFVGFDRLGEAEAFVKAVSGRIKGLGSNSVVAKIVRDKKIVNSKPREARPERSEEELLASLNDWEQHVDPKELEELEELGVNKEVLGLAFRSMRFHNSTYGPMDQALRSETLTPEREAEEEYRETIREYIRTVKECVATPENPGDLYKGMFGPNEELDLSIFDSEKERQTWLKEKIGG